MGRQFKPVARLGFWLLARAIFLPLKLPLTWLDRLNAAALWLLLCVAPLDQVRSANVVVIGDSVSAEYEMIPYLPPMENPTDYARISANGWESMSWVEVLARLRGDYFNFGRFKADLPGWPDLRFSGYEFNFAIPGFLAAQYEDIVTSSLFSNPQYLLFRSTLQDVLKNQADQVVIWLGANEFRANYGFLADGGAAQPLIDNLSADLKATIEFVQKQRSGLKIVIANLPDLGASPDKRNTQPDRAKRARVTVATKQANEAIAALAAAKGIAVADVFSQTERLINGVTTYFGAVDISPDLDLDNNPRYHFTRDGLHPNTPSQIEVARVMVETLNAAYQTAIPAITDGEALKFLHILPEQPYFDWIKGFAVSEKRMEDDPDRDGLPNIVEMAFDLDPAVRSEWPIVSRIESGRLQITYKPSSKYGRLVKVVPQRSLDLRLWTDLPKTEIRLNPNGSQTASLPISGSPAFLRLGVVLIVPE
jgi:lysophospholipase L1-like esterase